jgi:hypothetical protein
MVFSVVILFAFVGGYQHCSEMLVTGNNTTQHFNPEDCDLRLHHRENLSDLTEAEFPILMVDFKPKVKNKHQGNDVSVVVHTCDN